ncbi:MAG: PD-(D/E)XK nuclease family protein [Acidobacteria bacterium]|nr:PD-(D/E)XK nuclease family protein [Acidobacteriota bacterium]
MNSPLAKAMGKERKLGRTIVIQSPGMGVEAEPGQMVVTPNQRAAEVIGEKCLTLDEIAARILSDSGLKIASFGIRQRVLGEVIEDSVPEVDRTAMSVLFREGIDALLQDGVAPTELRAEASPRICALTRVAEAYLNRLRQMSMVDQAESLWRAAEINLRPRPMLLYGYFQPRRGEVALIDRLAGESSTFFLPTAEGQHFNRHWELIRWLSERGWQVKSRTEPSTLVNCGEAASRATVGWRAAALLLTGRRASELISCFSAATVEAEGREVMRRVGRLLASGVRAEKIALIANDEVTYSRSLQSIGREYGIGVRSRAEIPIAEHRLGGWVKLMMEMVGDGFGYEPTLRFLGHSLSPGLSGEQLSRAQRHRPVDLNDWRDAGIEPWPVGWPVWPGRSEMASRAQLNGIMAKILPLARPTYDAVATAAEQLTAKKLLEGLDALIGVASELVTTKQFTAEVIELLGRVRQPLAENTGIEVYRPEMVIGGRFSHIFFLGMIEGEVPRPIREEVILDLHERKRLQASGLSLETASDLVRRELLNIFFALETATESVTLSLPRWRGNEPSVVAGLIKSAQIEVVNLAGQPTTPFGVVESRRFDPAAEVIDDPVLPHLREAILIERSRELSTRRDEYDGITGHSVESDQRRWSASQLTSFGQCRFKWFCRYVLGVAEDGELPVETGSLQYGKLLHRTLELALAGLPPGSDPRQWALSRIEESMVEAERDPDNPLYQFPAWPAQRLERLERLRLAIESEGFIEPLAEVVSCERKFEGTWQGLNVRGSIDRIDRTPEGLTLIDYKTGSNHKCS